MPSISAGLNLSGSREGTGPRGNAVLVPADKEDAKKEAPAGFGAGDLAGASAWLSGAPGFRFSGLASRIDPA
jgi:hypothetical protein